jgi:hypothetical protein
VTLEPDEIFTKVTWKGEQSADSWKEDFWFEVRREASSKAQGD